MWPFKYPYANFHELNLDWLLEEVKRNKNDIDAIKDQGTQEIEEILSTMAASGELDSALAPFAASGYTNISTLDQNNLTAAIANAMTGSRGLYIPDGEYTADIILSKNWRIVGNGTINGYIDANGHTLVMDGVRVQNARTPILSTNPESRIVIRNSEIYADNSPIYITAAYLAILEDSKIESKLGDGYCVWIQNCSYAAVNKCVVGHNSPNIETHGVYYNNCQSAIANCNQITLKGQMFGICFNDCDNCFATDNYVLDSGREAIQAQSCAFVNIADNICRWSGAYPSRDYGISVFGYSDAIARTAVTNIITGNDIYNCKKSPVAVAGNVAYSLVSNNIAYANYNGVNEKAVVHVYKEVNSSGPSRVYVLGNVYIPGNIAAEYGVLSESTVSRGVCAFNSIPDSVGGDPTNWTVQNNIV